MNPIELIRAGLAEHLEHANEVAVEHVRGQRYRLIHPDTDRRYCVAVGRYMHGKRSFFVCGLEGSCFQPARSGARYSAAGAWRAAGAAAGKHLAADINGHDSC